MKPLRQRAEDLTQELFLYFQLPHTYISEKDMTGIIYNALINLDVEVRENIIESIEELRS